MSRGTTVDALRDAAHDAFMAFWRGIETDHAAGLWAAYCAAQERYDAYLMRDNSRRVHEWDGRLSRAAPG